MAVQPLYFISFSDRLGGWRGFPTELNPPLTFVRNTGWDFSLLSSEETDDGLVCDKCSVHY